MRLTARILQLTPAMVLALAACTSSTTGPGLADVADAPVLASIQPANASAGVDPAAPIVLRFSHAMMSGMEMLVVLHESSVLGTAVPATASWSVDRTTLTLMPTSPLKRATSYVVHLAPSLKDTSGHAINLTPGTMMGGMSVSAGMMGAGAMMNGQAGPGMIGAGWQAANGTYGMIYTFTTS